MPTTRALPDLFGRFTTIMGDHRRLAITLRDLRQVCGVLQSGGGVTGDDLQPDRLMDDLHADLTQHFAAEESDEYFGTVTQERPSLIPQVTALIAEHAQMLTAVASLREIAADKHRWRELVDPAARLIDRLQAHEHSETLVLQEFFLRDEGAGD